MNRARAGQWSCLKQSLRRGLVLGAIAAVSGLLISPARAQSSPSPEDQFKAAFIYHFAQYVEWPASAFADEKAPFVIGILGQTPLTGALKQAVNGKSLNGRPLVVQGLGSAAQASKGVQILFISASEETHFPEVVKTLQDTSVLTVVSEMSHFVDSGFAINLVREGDKIRFQIDEKVALKKPFKISSKLLSLASHRGG